MPSQSKMLCPWCGGNAWSLDELVASSVSPEETEAWRSILPADGYYCWDDDDVLLPGEARPRT